MSVPAEQREIVEFLERLAGAPPRETHISLVFAGDDTVWKLKKAVRLPFLDFSTLEARRHFLRRELELNRVNAPDIYRDVVPVGRRGNGALAVGEGTPVDWVLRMARVADEDFLDVVAERGGLTPEFLDRLGDSVAACHARLPSIHGWDSAKRMRLIAEGNAVSAREAGLPDAEVQAWLDACLPLVSALRPWLTKRCENGFVRRCHGDLHLGNMCLWRGEPVAFDALEFNEEMATIDTAYDLAFLLMDLDQHVSRDAANRVMNRYAARTGDAGLTGGLPLFLSQRAMIRAHILAATGRREPGLRLLRAAHDYLLPMTGCAVAIGGLQGTGKSTLARRLAPVLGRAPGALVLRSDDFRKRLFGRVPEERLGKDAYSEEANQRVNRGLIDLACVAASGGHAVIVDSTFVATGMREDLASRLAAMRTPFTGVWLEAPLAVLEQRIAARRGDASDATIAVLREAAKREPGAGDWHPVEATDGDTALASILKLLPPASLNAHASR